MVRTAFFLVATIAILPVIALTKGIDLSGIYLESFFDLVTIMVFVSLLCFTASELTGNYSQVDKIWSIIPVVYVWIIAAKSGFNDRILLMAIVSTIWGFRLTYNFARRGGYNLVPWRGEEDYRWSVLRKMPYLNNRFGWTLFNMLFISLYQNTLILLITLPALVAWQGADTPVNMLDIVATLLIILFIIAETVADQQQYDYHSRKSSWLDKKGEIPGKYARGFTAHGLWRFVRHPNYAAEQAIWLTFYLYGVAATGRLVNWSLAGAILLVLLFFGSSTFSENISAGKYPLYRDYIKQVPRFIPSVLRNRRYPKESS